MTTNEQTKKRRRLALLGGVVALLTFVWLSLDSAQTIRSTQTSQPDEESTDAAAAVADTSRPSPGLSSFRSASAEPSAAFQVAAAVDAETPDPNRPQLRSLSKEAADDYRKRARFPQSSQPLEGTADPILEDRTVSGNSMGGDNGAEPLLYAMPAAISFEAPESAVLYAYFTEGDERIAADGLVAEFAHELRGPEGSLVMNDEGELGDEIAGDLIYTGRFTPPADNARDFRGSWIVTVRGRTLDLDERAVSTGFLYSVPDAKPTGRFVDRLADGSLEIGVEVDVAVRGRFHVEGVLAHPDGASIAWAQQAAELEAGRHWIDLSFYGLALRERGLDGPFVLRSLSMSTTSLMPNQKNNVLTDAHTTKAYVVADFTDQPFDDPDLLDAAERLEGAGIEAPDAITP